MTDRKLDSIVILGGGCAGWMTALMLRKLLPTSRITVVHDGTTDEDLFTKAESASPSFVYFLDAIGIPVSTLIAQADATIKTGAMYSGWCGDDSSFYHGFALAQDYNLAALDNRDFMTNTSILCAMQESIVSSLDNVNFSWMTAKEGKVTFAENKDISKEKFVNDPIFRYNSLGNFGLHFDTKKFTDVLSAEATSRGVTTIVSDEGLENAWYTRREGSEEVESVHLGKQSFKCDFVFVCGRKIPRISPPSKSTNDVLPIDSLVLYDEKHAGKKIHPYTEVVAMDYGWMSKIPLQSGVRCSYFFDSTVCSSSDVIKEIKDKTGASVDPASVIRLYQGYQTSPWAQNSVSIGLCASEVEPLDCSPIWSTVLAVLDIASDMHKLASRDQRISEEYNERHRSRNEQMIAFVYAHYMGEKSGTSFWDKFKDKDAVPTKTKKVLETTEYRALEYSDFLGEMYSLEDWAQVLSGLRLLDIELYKRICEENFVEDRVSRYREIYLGHLRGSVEQCANHVDFIERLRKKSIV